MTLSEIRESSRVVVRRPSSAAGWVGVCPVDRLTPNRGVAALVAGRAIALFRLADGSLHAIDNIDPISGASVLSRGIVGEADGSPTVASPMYKQRFDLRSGRCLDREHTTIGTHEARERDEIVQVRLSP
jgi:nitrite reductase (NADH) small subunit